MNAALPAHIYIMGLRHDCAEHVPPFPSPLPPCKHPQSLAHRGDGCAKHEALALRHRWQVPHDGLDGRAEPHVQQPVRLIQHDYLWAGTAANTRHRCSSWLPSVASIDGCAPCCSAPARVWSLQLQLSHHAMSALQGDASSSTTLPPGQQEAHAAPSCLYTTHTTSPAPPRAAL